MSKTGEATPGPDTPPAPTTPTTAAALGCAGVGSPAAPGTPGPAPSTLEIILFPTIEYVLSNARFSNSFRIVQSNS
ncbi:hypothetical protein BLOT_016112 [Blomia tropicalis]|nr:hypothetical protein BLOT_016112 [Blomia tropicalis]